MKTQRRVLVILTLSCSFSIPLSSQTYRSASDWRTMIDTTWGAGLPTATKLMIFDTFWNKIDQDFACFHNLPVDWDLLRSTYRPEIEAGVSRGRFAAIMNHMALALMEAHTFACDKGVMQTSLAPGIPLLVYTGWHENGHFGASLTPLPDSSLLVYKVVENHPLGLEPGDVVLGYHGIPWKTLYKELIAAQLPLTSTIPLRSDFATFPYGGSHEQSSTHAWLSSAGLNWHLFDTIDVEKFSTHDTLHLSTSALVGKNMQLNGTEQMPIPGVPFPDLSAGKWSSYGVVEGTKIGYIYTLSWPTGSDADIQFRTAILDLMYTYHVEGLIIDSRVSHGGDPYESNQGLKILFNTDTYEIDDVRRNSPTDHFRLTPAVGAYVGRDYLGFVADTNLFDKPIAVLVGPGAVSNAEYMTLLLTFHPTSRHFGKKTNGSFGIITPMTSLSEYGWIGSYSFLNSYLIDTPGSYLSHVSYDVDEEIWLSREGVATGRDDVVERAIEWISATNPAVRVVSAKDEIPRSFLLSQNFPNPFNSRTTVPFTVHRSLFTTLKVFDVLGREVATLVSEELSPGSYSVEWDAGGMPSGVYWYRLEMGEFVETKTMILVK